MPDLLDEAFGVDIGQTDLVDTLEFGRHVLAIRARLAIAGVFGQTFAVVALDDQAGIGVDHVEIADIVAVLLQQILPRTACPLVLDGIEFKNAQVFAIALLLPFLFFGIPQRAFEQRVELAAILGGGHTLKAAGTANWRAELAGNGGCGDRVMVGRLDDLAIDLSFKEGQHLALAVGLDQIGTEFVTEPEVFTDGLNRFDVQIHPGQIA